LKALQKLERFARGKASCSLNDMALSKGIRQQLQRTQIRPCKIENYLTPSVPLQKACRCPLAFTDGVGMPVKPPQGPERHLQQKRPREILHREQYTVALYQHYFQWRITTETCRMAMVNHSCWNVPRAPTQEPCAHAEVRVVTESEKRFIEAAGLLEQLTVIEGGARIRPQDLLRPIILPNVCFHCAAAPVLSIPVDQVAGFVDNLGGLLKENFARQHSYTFFGLAVSDQLFKPIRLSNSISVQKCNPLAARTGEGKIISFAKAGIGGKKDRLCARQALGPRSQELTATVARTVVDQDEICILPGR